MGFPCTLLGCMVHLIQECTNAAAAGTTVKELSMIVHTHLTLCEVMDEAFKGALGILFEKLIKQIRSRIALDCIIKAIFC